MAVDSVSFEIQEGEFFSLLGPNGAGKTTTINMISGLMHPDQGQILLHGNSIHDSLKVSKKQMGIVPQEIALYEELSAWENLLFWGNLYAMQGNALRSRANELLELVGLSDRKNDRIRTFSGGMKRRINIAAALMHNPQLIIMDEPTVGIDPHSRTRIYALLENLHQQGKTILYTTHYMEEAEKMSSRIGIIDHGKIIASGTLQQLKQLSGIRETMHIQVDNITDSIALPEHISAQQNPETNTIKVFCTDMRTEAPLVIKSITDAGAVIMHLDVQTINLENIFLHLTGTQLRD